MNLWPTAWGRLVGISLLTMALTAGRSAELISSNSEPLNILLIYSGNVFVPASILQDQPMRATITAGAGRMVNFHLENLPDYNLSEIDYEREMAELIFHRHRLHPPDLTIAGGTAALNFLDRHRETLWPEKPAMFYSVLESLVHDLKLPVNVTGRTITFDANGTIDLALKLHPATAQLVVLTGANQAGWSWLPGIRAHLQAHYPTLVTTYLTNQTVEEMSASLAALSRSDVVLYTGVAQDAAGRRCDSLDVLTQITKSAGAPVYGLGEHHFGHGVVGGVIPSFAEQGRQAGLLALRLLAGESPASIPVEPGSTAVPMVDWHQLKRWQISESLLPAGTVIVNRDPTLWEEYRGEIIGVAVLVLFQTLVIAGLFIERLRRRRAEARMRLATTAANVGIWEWDVSRDRFWLSDVIRSRVGMDKSTRPSVEQMLETVHADDRQEVRKAVDALMKGGSELMVECRSCAPDGTVRWNSVQGRLEREWNGKRRHLRGVSIDITERKQNELSLQESEARFRHLADTAPVMIWMSGPDMRFNYFNKRWLDYTGRTLEQGLDGGTVEAIHPDDRERCRDIYTAAFGARREFTMQCRLRKHDGEYGWMFDTGVPRFGADGQFLGYIGSCVDITVQKQAEELQRDLAHFQRVATTGQLATTLAHELNQPLGAILRNAEAAELFLQQDPPELEELRAILTDIRKDDQRAGAVIDRMRSLLKRRDPEFEPLGLKELVDQVAALVRPEIKMRHATSEFGLPDGLPPVRGDRVQLQQVLLNLLMNSLDALEDLPSERRRLSMTARAVGPQTVEVAVSDWGRGIPMDRLSDIFKPFSTTKPKGLGMGLAISHAIIAAHGGRIWVENNPQGGATFRFTLKIAEDGGTA